MTKSVRSLARDGLVIGGHPGITPRYRGGCSAFWALYNSKPEDVGWTVFNLDSGADTGPIISSGRTLVHHGDSFVSLDWKGMTRIAEEQIRVIAALDQGAPVQLRPREPIPDDSFFGYLTLWD